MSPLKILSRVLMFSALTIPLTADTLLEEGFESGVLEAPWSSGHTDAGRVTIETQFEPATGQRHLVLDDQSNDAEASVAEAVLSLDLTKKRNVQLGFKAKSLGNEPHTPPSGVISTLREFDAVTVSFDGGGTWRVLQSLAGLGGAWQSFTIALDPIATSAGVSYGSQVRIRFSAYDNSPAPIDGIALDDVIVTAEGDQRSSVELPGQQIPEGAAELSGFVLVSTAPTEPLTLTLVASPTELLDIPQSVTIPAGEKAVGFSFSVRDDTTYYPNRSVSLSATGPGIGATATTIIIEENDLPKVSLVVPNRVTEGDPFALNSTLSIDVDTAVPLKFSLTATPIGQASFPSTLTMLPGQKQLRFATSAVDDPRIDKDFQLLLRASAPGLVTVQSEVLVVDNESPVIQIDPRDEMREGSSISTMVRLGGTLATPTTIGLRLKSGQGLVIPSSLTIPAGQTTASFDLRAIDDMLVERSRRVVIEASAAGLVEGGLEILIRDNDVAALATESILQMMPLGVPVNLMLRSYNLDGEQLTVPLSQVELSVETADGTRAPVSPQSVPMGSGSWLGEITLPDVATRSPVRLRFAVANGVASYSRDFEVMRRVPIAARDMIWDRVRQRLYCSVSSTVPGAYANRVVALDPVSLQVVGSVEVGRQPWHLALSSGAEMLYASLDEDGSIARINPATLQVLSTFSLGTTSSDDPLFARDMVVVPGRPETLVVLRESRSPSITPHSVAAFDSGMRRPQTTPSEGPFCRGLEPSSSPERFFAYDSDSQMLRHLRLDSTGVSWGSGYPVGISYGADDFRSDSDRVFFNSGDIVDGLTGRTLWAGSPERKGPILPEWGRNRVFTLYRDLSGSSAAGIVVDVLPDRLGRQVMGFQSPLANPGSFLRWGEHGLAFRTATDIKIIQSESLMPGQPEANLVTTIEVDSFPGSESPRHTYTVRIANQGPGVARAVVADVNFPVSRTIESPEASQGRITLIGRSTAEAEAVLGDVPAGHSATFRATVLSNTYGFSVATARARSSTDESNFSDNVASRWVAGIGPVPANGVASMGVPLSDLVYDGRRRVLWGTCSSYLPAPLDGALVSIDPETGRPLRSILTPQAALSRSLALSSNGRYLYFAAKELGTVVRMDLEADPPAAKTLVLMHPERSDRVVAGDIVVLPGDGTSFVVAGAHEQIVVVYDGEVPRPKVTFGTPVNRIQQGANPGELVSLGFNGISVVISRITIAADGATVAASSVQQEPFLYDIAADGNRLLWGYGRLFDSATLSTVKSLGVEGFPCVDSANQRALIATTERLQAFDLVTGAAIDALNLPGHVPTQSICLRWGFDGFAVLSNYDFRLRIGRWGQLIFPSADHNGNRIPDRWEAANLGPFGGDLASDRDGDGLPGGLEYVFGTPANVSSSDPRHVSAADPGVLRLRFPRRAGLGDGFYRYEAASGGLDAWEPVVPVRESVLDSQTVNGVVVETIEAEFQFFNAPAGFVRLGWPAR